MGESGCLPEGVEYFAGDLSELVHRGQQRPHRPSEPGTLWAKRMGTTTYQTDGSHVPMLSDPSLVIDVIRTAANAVEQSTAAQSALGILAGGS
jgi:hypothetical protein